ncbi:MAG: heme-binding protein [Mycobacterium sp.]|nr:heme-binding protein [Mycobacterium sp.]
MAIACRSSLASPTHSPTRRSEDVHSLPDWRSHARRRDPCRHLSSAIADDPPNCTAADLAGIMSGVSAGTSSYLFTHPDVNAFLTSLKGRSKDDMRTAVEAYFEANPQVSNDLKGIRQPAADSGLAAMHRYQTCLRARTRWRSGTSRSDPLPALSFGGLRRPTCHDRRSGNRIAERTNPASAARHWRGSRDGGYSPTHVCCIVSTTNAWASWPVRRSRDGGYRTSPSHGSPCSRWSAPQRRTMPGRRGSSPRDCRWF